MGRLFPSLALNHTAASALALRRSSALECPHKGPAEPSPRTEHNHAAWPKQGEASGRSAYGFAPSLGWEHTCKLYSLSLFIAGSWIGIPQAEAKLLCAIPLCSCFPWRGKGGKLKKKSLKLPISANLSYNGRFCRPKSDPPREGAAAEPANARSCRRVNLWMSSQRLKLNRRNMAQLGSLPASLHPAFFQL